MEKKISLKNVRNREIPWWITKKEFKSIFDLISTNEVTKWAKAYKLMNVWVVRRQSQFPDGLKATYEIIQALVKASEVEDPTTKSILYKYAIVRFVSFVTSLESKSDPNVCTMYTMKNIAFHLEIPFYLTLLRNEIVHGYIDSYNVHRLKENMMSCLSWIKSYYWDKFFTESCANDKIETSIVDDDQVCLFKFRTALENFEICSLVKPPSDIKKVIQEVAINFASYFSKNPQHAMELLIRHFFCSYSMEEAMKTYEASNKSCCSISLPRDVLSSIAIVLKEISNSVVIENWFSQMLNSEENSYVKLKWMEMMFALCSNTKKICRGHESFKILKITKSLLWRRIIKKLFISGRKEFIDLAFNLGLALNISRPKLKEIASVCRLYADSLVYPDESTAVDDDDFDANSKIWTKSDLLQNTPGHPEELHRLIQTLCNKSQTFNEKQLEPSEIHY